MSEYQSTDLPATSKFQKEIISIQQEYKIAIDTGIHPDENFDKAYELNDTYYNDKCGKFYERKILALAKRLIDEHNNSKHKSIKLIDYQRFKDLFLSALFETSTFL